MIDHRTRGIEFRPRWLPYFPSGRAPGSIVTLRSKLRNDVEDSKHRGASLTVRGSGRGATRRPIRPPKTLRDRSLMDAYPQLRLQVRRPRFTGIRSCAAVSASRHRRRQSLRQHDRVVNRVKHACRPGYLIAVLQRLALRLDGGRSGCRDVARRDSLNCHRLWHR
jgi:hypothetical protein